MSERTNQLAASLVDDTELLRAVAQRALDIDERVKASRREDRIREIAADLLQDRKYPDVKGLIESLTDEERTHLQAIVSATQPI